MIKLLTMMATVALATAVSAAPATAPDTDAPTVRVRTTDARSANLLRQGLERSLTMQALVTELEGRDVIVYIEMQPLMKKGLAGTLSWVTSTPLRRYVRIALHPELGTELAIATLGHELQHALEIARAPEIVCARTFTEYYTQHGALTKPNGWDTEAARVIGANVRRELAANLGRRADARTARPVAESIQPFNPNDWLVVYRHTRSMLPP